MMSFYHLITLGYDFERKAGIFPVFQAEVKERSEWMGIKSE